GAIEDRGVAPVPGDHPHLAVASLDVRKVPEDREDLVPVLDLRRLDRLEEALLVPARHLVVAGVGEIGPETGLDLGEGVVVIAEDSCLDAVRMRVEEAL